MKHSKNDKQTLCTQVLSSPVHFFAFGFGSGLSTIAPGTVGTLAAIPLYLILSYLPLLGYLAALALIIVFGIWVCGESARRLNLEDPGGIVWDEFAGFFVTMIAAPAGFIWIVIGFILFRIFDIWKPQPIKWLDKHVKGGLGIMLDDIAAGVYALLSLQLIYWITLQYT